MAAVTSGSILVSFSPAALREQTVGLDNMIVYISIIVCNYHENIYHFPGSTVAQLGQIEM